MIQDFIFDGQSLSGFGYMICNFNSGGQETKTVSEMNFTGIKAPVSDISHKVSTSYETNLSRTIQICKSPCSNDAFNIRHGDISELTKWLCRKDYKWFKWIDDADNNEIFYEVQINIKKIELYGNHIGFELDIISNRPYALTREMEIHWNRAVSPTMLLNVYSDEEGYIYPDMAISLKESGNLEICNKFENRTTYIGDCRAGEIITIWGNDIQQIKSNASEHDFSQSFNYNFPRLCNLYRQSMNEISVNLNCDIEIKYRGIRKVGI